MQNFPADAAMLENLGLPLTSDRVRERLRLPNPTPSRYRVRIKADLRCISPSEEDPPRLTDLKRVPIDKTKRIEEESSLRRLVSSKEYGVRGRQIASQPGPRRRLRPQSLKYLTSGKLSPPASR